MPAQNLAANYISDAARLESEVKISLETIVSLIKELPGGTGDTGVVTLASNTFAVSNDVSVYPLDTQGAIALDTLRTIGGTPRNGQLIALRLTNSAHQISVINGVGGAGQILTKNGRNFTLVNTSQFAILKYVSTAPGYWEEWIRDDVARIDQLPGAQPATTLTIGGSVAQQVTATMARHLITTAGADHLDQITSTNLLDGMLLSICMADSLFARTLKHNVTGTGKLNLIGAADIIMQKDTYYTFVKNGAQWDHLWTDSGRNFPTVGAADRIPYLSATDTPGLLPVYPGTDGYLLTKISSAWTWAIAMFGVFGGVTDRSIALFSGTTGQTLKNGPALGAAGTVLRSGGASADPSFTEVTQFVSADQTITAAGSLSLTHSIAAGAPKNAWMALVCQTAEAGYSIGDVVIVGSMPQNATGGAASITITTTQLIIRFSSVANTFNLPHKTTGVWTALTNANWKARFYAQY